MSDDEQYTADERRSYLREEAEKLVPGDKIMLLRNRSPSLVDIAPGDETVPPDHWWETAEIVRIVERAPAGDLVFELKFGDGRTVTIPLLASWRRCGH